MLILMLTNYNRWGKGRTTTRWGKRRGIINIVKEETRSREQGIIPIGWNVIWTRWEMDAPPFFVLSWAVPLISIHVAVVTQFAESIYIYICHDGATLFF
jgi:hypothetical protein